MVIANDRINPKRFRSIDRGFVTDSTIHRNNQRRFLLCGEMIDGFDRKSVSFFFAMRNVERDCLFIKST